MIGMSEYECLYVAVVWELTFGFRILARPHLLSQQNQCNKWGITSLTFQCSSSCPEEKTQHTLSRVDGQRHPNKPSSSIIYGAWVAAKVFGTIMRCLQGQCAHFCFESRQQIQRVEVPTLHKPYLMAMKGDVPPPYLWLDMVQYLYGFLKFTVSYSHCPYHGWLVWHVWCFEQLPLLQWLRKWAMEFVKWWS